MIHVTKPERKDPTRLRTIRSFDTVDAAVEWATRYIFEDDKRLFIDLDTGQRLGSVTFDKEHPIVNLSK